MNIKILSLLGGLILLLASCSQVYSPALYYHDIAYQPKPASFDSARSANYVSAALATYPTSNYNNTIVSGQINLSRGHAFNNFNLAYGAFGVFGDYQNGSTKKSDPNYFNDKFFGALGGRASANFFVNSGNTDFRFIGMEIAYSHEFGPYADFRKVINTQPGSYVDPRTELFTAALTTEVIFHNRNNTLQHGIRGFLATTPGHNNLDDTYYNNDSGRQTLFHNIFPGASYFIKFKNYFGTAEIGNQLFIRFGYTF